MPGFARILKRSKVGQRPAELLGENTVEIHEALVPRAVQAAGPSGNPSRQLSALCCLVFIGIDASIVNENHRVQQPHRLIAAIDLDRAEANGLQADVDADPVADTRNIF